VTLIEHARRDLEYGAVRTRIWLERVHRIRVAATTIRRICHRLGYPSLRRKPARRPRQLTLFSRERPGDSVSRWTSKKSTWPAPSASNTPPLMIALAIESSVSILGKISRPATCSSALSRPHSRFPFAKYNVRLDDRLGDPVAGESLRRRHRPMNRKRT